MSHKHKKNKSVLQTEQYPRSFVADIEDVPEAKDWEVGKEYELNLKVKQVGRRKDKFEDTASFEILKVKNTNNPHNKQEKRLLTSDGYLKRK